MQLSKFIVKNYRSISDATLNDIGKYCVIVGPNNSGKSNLLRALIIALSIATEGDFKRDTRRRGMSSYAYVYEGKGYNWTRDIPRSIAHKDEAHTVFKLTFEFSPEEKEAFSKNFGINLSKSLQMSFNLFRQRSEYNIVMPGKAKAPMEKQMVEIGMFIRSRLDHQYIPCVRTSEFTSDYFAQLLSKELRSLESDEEFQNLTQRIRELQRPILEGLEQRLTTALQMFLPNVRKAKIDLDFLLSDTSLGIDKFKLRRTPISVDDGDLTSLDDKGDGVKSLAAISLVQSLSLENATDKSLILCIEEPESHLHPEAIHSLRNVILDITDKANLQVVISTHSPLLVDRDNPKNNVQISEDHNVKACSSIAEIRELLGIRLTDNLDGLKRVVLVEGDCDKIILSRISKDLNEKIRTALEEGTLEFVSVGSSSKMDNQIRLYNSLLIPSLVILDSDTSGIEAQKKLVDSKLKRIEEVLVIKCKGMRECEIEDLIDYKQYASILLSQFNIDINTIKFKNRNRPWSDRIKQEAGLSPIGFTDEIEKQIKISLSQLVHEIGIQVIPDYNMDTVTNLVNCIARFCKMDDA
ncbi:MAG: AAA family ATPase [Sphaerochaeta sp.]|nr:AAA family ATPase [Sphaerochaeta sp.]